MSEALQRARESLEAEKARTAQLVSEIHHRNPHLSKEQIEDVLDTLWMLGEFKK